MTTVRLRDRPTALYHLYDALHRLLYIGIAVDLERRWEAHRRASSWWPEVTEKVVVWFPDRTQASAAETEAIESLHPVHNKSRIPAVRPAGSPKTNKFSLYLSDDVAARVKGSGLTIGQLIRRGLEAEPFDVMLHRVIREELAAAARDGDRR